MTDTQTQIIAMLKAGMSYSTIQEELRVSSKTVSATKKAFMETDNSSEDRLSSTFLHRDPEPPPLTDYFKPNSISFEKPAINQTTKTRKTMSNYNNDYDQDDYDDNEPVTRLSLEKYRLQLEHELEIAKMEAEAERHEANSKKEDREYHLKEQELQLKRDEFEAIQERKNDEMRSLLFRIKKLSEQCEDGEYSYEEVETMLENAEELLSDCEKYCFINKLKFEDTESHTMLSEIIESLSDFLDSTDDGETNYLAFESSLDNLISKATFRSL